MIARHASPRAFYVTIRHGSQTIYALGPFAHHARALGLAETVRLTIGRSGLDRWCEYGYGTSSMPARTNLPAGAFNDAFRVGPCPELRKFTASAQRMPAAVLARVSETIR
jgi:hypothetical protein